MRAVTPAVVEKSVTRLLGENGYSVVRENGIARVVKADKAAKDVMVYRPKHRSTSYLVGTVSALFPQGSFTYPTATKSLIICRKKKPALWAGFVLMDARLDYALLAIASRAARAKNPLRVSCLDDTKVSIR